MLLFDGGDLGIELTSHGVGEHRTDRHVVVMCLVFCGHDGHGVEFRERFRRGAIVVLAQVVCRVTVLNGGRPARHDVRIILDDVVGVTPADPVTQGREPVKVKEIFQQAEPIHLGHIVVRFAFRHASRHLDCHLLEGHT